jgi:diguanylate cyclase (GGDEF)-like protein
MRTPTTPPDEARRLASLEALNVLFTPAEERFDRITRCATKLLDVPISTISLVAANEQWFKSAQGIDTTGTPRPVSFCGHAILSDEPLVVPDSLLDARFFDNPLVQGEPFVRAYAGQPLHDAEGHRIGSFCVIDQRPREFTAEQLATLRDLARWAEVELAANALSASQRNLIEEVESLRRIALVDRLTRAWNRGAIDDVFGRELERGWRDRSSVGIVLFDIDRFKSINDSYGHPAGDEVLREVARRTRSVLRPFDAFGRYGGEEFLVVLSDCGLPDATAVAERLAAALREQPVVLPGGREISITASFGVVAAVPTRGSLELGEWIDHADQFLYRAKRAGRDQVVAGDTQPFLAVA